MRKELSEMTMEELWELFPIFLVGHRERWKDDYREIAPVSVHADHLRQGIGSAMIRLGIEKVKERGFLVMSAGAGRISLNKGYTKEGFAKKVYHIHLRYAGDNDELYFRDYLTEHPDVAKGYEAMKLDLWKKYEHNRDAYTEAKGDFVRRRTEEARKEYGDRYQTNEKRVKNVIETKRLKIYTASDEQMRAVIAAETEAEMKIAYTEMLDGCLAHPAQREWYAIRTIERKDGTPIGDLCFKGLSDDGVTEIGYGIDGQYRGQGYATEAVTAAVAWALGRPGVACVIAEVDKDNIASRRVLEKAGFAPAGRIGEEGPIYKIERERHTKRK